MGYRDPQTPGIDIGSGGLTGGEVATVQEINGLENPGADRILFWDHSALAWALLTVGSGLSITGTTIAATGAGLSDADYGDITVGGSGTTMTIDNDVVTYAKMQNVSATDKILGRVTGGAGDVEEITFTDLAQSLADDATASAFLTTLGLDTDLLTFSVPALTTISAFGATIVDDANAAAVIATLGLDADLATFSLPASTTISAFGATIVDDANAAAVLTTLGITADVAELNFVDGVTSAIQTQLNGKASTTLNNLGTTAINAHLLFDTDAAYDIGSSTVGVNDLHFGSGGVINFDGGDVLLTHSADTLTLSGGTLVTNDVRLTSGSGVRTGTTSGNTFLLQARDVDGGAYVAVATITAHNDPTFLLDTTYLRIGSLTGVLRADSGAVSVDTDVTDLVSAASATAQGKVELATDAETVTGTDTARATTPANITAKMAAPGAIGGTTPSTAVFTTVTINTVLNLAENASIALDPAGSADGKYTGITITGTAGATLAFGDLIYFAVADSRWELADADAASTSGDVQLGMCVLAAAADGNATTILLFGTIRADAAFPALTIGAPVYVSTTAGDIQVAQPSGTDDVIRRVGFALTADEIMFNPSNDYITHI